MSAVIDKPRAELSEFAPKVHSLKIKQDKIGELIGPGGKNIKAIVAESGAGRILKISEDGTIFGLIEGYAYPRGLYLEYVR